MTNQVIKPNLSTLEVTLNNENPGYAMPNDLSIEISGDINSQTGTVDLDVSDDATKDSSKTQNNLTVLKVTKVPNVFFVNNFVSASPDDPSTPLTEFKNGDAIQFNWEGNGTNYKIYQGGASAPVYDDSKTQATLKDGLTLNTSFVLQATSNATGNTQTLYQSITITISNPDLTPKSSDISGAEATGDGLKVENGKVALNGTNLTVSSESTFSENLTVKGEDKTTTTSVEALEVSEHFHAIKDVEVSNSLYVGSDAWLEGGLKVTGHETKLDTTTVALFGDSNMVFESSTKNWPANPPSNGPFLLKIPATPIKASTDGLLFVALSALPSGDQSHYSTVTIAVGNETYETSTPAYTFNKEGRANIKTSQTLTLPVQKGQVYTYSGTIHAHNHLWVKIIYGSIKITWFPLGLAASSESVETVTHHQEVIEDTELLVEEMVIEEGPGHDEKIELLVEAIHNISDSTESRQTMTDLLKDIL